MAFALAKSAVPLKLNAMEPWRRLWYRWAGIAFLKGYLETSKEAKFMPSDAEEFMILLEAYTLEKAVYELGYELNNRPDWVGIPLQGILEIYQANS